MRDIKFRAWIKKENRIEGCIDVNPFYIGDCDRFHWKHNEVELMQYTGLKDKNGKEIYEGDIVRFAEWNRGELCWVGSICYDYCLYCIRGGKNKECDSDFEIQLSRIPSNRVEIIGNVYENPELIIK